MTPKELRLAARMLQDFTDYYQSPAGCNDTDPAWLKEFSPEEIDELNRQFHELNGDPEESDGDRLMSDFCYTALMIEKLQRLAKRTDELDSESE